MTVPSRGGLQTIERRPMTKLDSGMTWLLRRLRRHARSFGALAVPCAILVASPSARADQFRCDLRRGGHALFDVDSHDAAMAAARQKWGDVPSIGCRSLSASNILPAATSGPAAAALPRAPLYVTPGFKAAPLSMETEVTAIYLATSTMRGWTAAVSSCR